MIQIALISNFLSIHQKSLCDAFLSLDNVSFKFVSCFGPSGLKKSLSFNENDNYVIRIYESIDQYNVAKCFIDSCDFIIFGSGDKKIIKDYKGTIFFYSEHFSKDFLFPLRAIHVHFLYKKYKNSYLLCASSFAKKDYKYAKLFENRCLYFGYFPYPTINKEKHVFNDNNRKYLWCGRDVDFKRLSLAFFSAKCLYKNNCNFELTIVTQNGFSLNKLIKKNRKKPWYKHILIINYLQNDEIRKKMFESDYFLLTSNKGEGWGAVLNEAMDEGCCCISSEKAGSTNYLIKNGSNGFVFKNKRSFEKVLKQTNNLSIEDLENISINARYTIEKTWNAKKAASNLIASFKAINNLANIQTKEEPGYFIL